MQADTKILTNVTKQIKPKETIQIVVLQHEFQKNLSTAF